MEVVPKEFIFVLENCELFRGGNPYFPLPVVLRCTTVESAERDARSSEAGLVWKYISSNTIGLKLLNLSTEEGLKYAYSLLNDVGYFRTCLALRLKYGFHMAPLHQKVYFRSFIPEDTPFYTPSKEVISVEHRCLRMFDFNIMKALSEVMPPSFDGVYRGGEKESFPYGEESFPYVYIFRPTTTLELLDRYHVKSSR